jgi:hypothetical protein
MAAGDAVIPAASSIAAGAYLAIQPGAGVEWCVHNILAGLASCELSFYDGTNIIIIDTQGTSTTGNGWVNQVYFVNNSCYLRLKNNESTARLFSFTGVVTK